MLISKMPNESDTNQGIIFANSSPNAVLAGMEVSLRLHIKAQHGAEEGYRRSGGLLM
jgi:hypothetical protein